MKKTPIYWEEIKEYWDDIVNIFWIIVFALFVAVVSIAIYSYFYKEPKLVLEKVEYCSYKDGVGGCSYSNIYEYRKCSENVDEKTGKNSTTTYKFCIK